MMEFLAVVESFLGGVDFSYFLSFLAILIAVMSRNIQEVREAFLDEVRSLIESTDDSYINRWGQWYYKQLCSRFPDMDDAGKELRLSHFKTLLYKAYRIPKGDIIRRVRKNGWLKKVGGTLDNYIHMMNEKDQSRASTFLQENWSSRLLEVPLKEFEDRVTVAEIEKMGFDKYKDIIEEYKSFKRATAFPISMDKALEIIYQKRGQ